MYVYECMGEGVKQGESMGLEVEEEAHRALRTMLR